MLSYDKTKQKKRKRSMKTTGVKKEIDKLGRICIPKEMRALFNLDGEVEIRVTKDGLLITNPEYILAWRSDYEV